MAKSLEKVYLDCVWIFAFLLLLLSSAVEAIDNVSKPENKSDPMPSSVRNVRESNRPIWSTSNTPSPSSLNVDNKLQQSQSQNKAYKSQKQVGGKKGTRNGVDWGDHATQPTHGPWTQWTSHPHNNNCTCVPYYYCDEGQVVTDGSGVIDIRNGWTCQSILEVCCRQPRPTQSPTSYPWGPTHSPSYTSTAIPGFAPRCGTLNPNGVNARILGFKDSETQFGEYPFMAGILEKKMFHGRYVNYFLCGGSLVWPSVIITAAHCVKGKKADHLLTRLGEWDTQSTNEFYPHQDIWGQEIVIHPDYYAGSLYNDIALVFLQRPAVLAPHIDTICLPPTTWPAYDNSSCFATGWGKNSFGHNGSYQAILKEVELPIVPRSVCQDALRRTNLGNGFNLHESFLCAGGLKGQDTCVGDGGGPLVCPSLADPWRYVLAGIVSWGVNCGQYGVPGVYTDVTKFRQWIEHVISTRVSNFDPSKVTIHQYGHGQYG